ncbi:hypothetical protein AXK11_09105 [Cephaloticoccus primus]|uniref:Universal stress protein n=1 Tax=Cephaloticoccus primus TaxID=1548207 RepID=A0A139SHV9_9BACT|nr:universal stress protein [Cephaloticoccus primus]KXU34074.1 hypothetical protein AXK11_09105 [Cephaloticoccus primus]
MKTILAPIDFSRASNSVLKVAINLAREHNARIVLLHIVQPPVLISEYGAIMTNVQDIVAISERTSAKELDKRQKSVARSAGVPVEVAQATGAPVRSIIEQAKKTKADYIVVGSHGHSALYDLFAGSTASGLIRRAPCPVVVVPPHPTKKTKKR